MAARRGYKVVATTANGTEGALKIRDLGAIPVYPDLTRAGELRSVMLMSRADVVVHFAAGDINGPAQHALDYETLAEKVRLSTAALVQAAGDIGAKRVILPGFSFLYGNTGDTLADEDSDIRTDSAFFADAAAAEALVLDGVSPGLIERVSGGDIRFHLLIAVTAHVDDRTHIVRHGLLARSQQRKGGADDVRATSQASQSRYTRSALAAEGSPGTDKPCSPSRRRAPRRSFESRP